MTTERPAFSPLQRLLHWLMAICILVMLFVGVGMVSTVAPSYLKLTAFHKSLGIAILVLAVLRLILRLRKGAPPLPTDLPESLKLAAQASHVLFYALLFAMPLIGWAMVSAGGYPVVVFGGLHLPSILPPDREMHALLWDAHRYLAFAFFGLILMHIAAALFHGFIRRDGVLQQMTGTSG